MANVDLISIFKHTPFWVWGLLGFLIFRGVTALKARTIKLGRALILPVIFFVWPLAGIYSEFQNRFVGLGGFFAGILLGVGAGLYLWRGNGIYLPETKEFERKGSPITLCLVIGAFLSKYILTVILHLHPERSSDIAFSILFAGISGVWDGLFWGGTVLLLMQMRRVRASSPILT
jgi:hypothetical protein